MKLKPAFALNSAAFLDPLSFFSYATSAIADDTIKSGQLLQSAITNRDCQVN